MKIIEHDYKPKTPYTQRKKTKYIILHCAATPEGNDYTVEQINQWHLKKGWNTIGYHYIIYRNGEIHQGRPMEAVGAHCSSCNSISIGICYIGGVKKDCKTPKDTRTDEQKEAMYQLVDYLLKHYNLRLDAVYGHYEFDQTKDCPSFKIYKFRDEYNKWKQDKYEKEQKQKADKVPICYFKDWFEDK